jgi:sec-independent protein translocase protein TatA
MPIGFHPIELIGILVIALLIFGPKKLPEMGSAIGKGIKEFQNGMKELSQPKEDKSATSLTAIEREIASKRTASVETPRSEYASTETIVD